MLFTSQELKFHPPPFESGGLVLRGGGWSIKVHFLIPRKSLIHNFFLWWLNYCSSSKRCSCRVSQDSFQAIDKNEKVMRRSLSLFILHVLKCGASQINVLSFLWIIMALWLTWGACFQLLSVNQEFVRGSVFNGGNTVLELLYLFLGWKECSSYWWWNRYSEFP